MKANQPIGIFDSGVGGLTIAKSVISELPREDIIYFGDTAHLPYGDKSAKTITNYALRLTDILLKKKCKLILIACNSAASAASSIIKEYAKHYAHVIDVIDPAINVLQNLPANQKIGLIGTKQTIQSNVYTQRIAASRPDLTLVTKATKLLAAAIEEFGEHAITDNLIKTYLSDPAFKNIDIMLLACTHYPAIKSQFRAFLGANIKIIDQAEAIALAAKKWLTQSNLLSNKNSGEKHFYVSDLTDTFRNSCKRFFKEPIKLEHYPLLPIKDLLLQQVSEEPA